MNKFPVTSAVALWLCILHFCQCSEANNSSGIMELLKDTSLGRTFSTMGDVMWSISHGMSEAMGHWDDSWMHGGVGHGGWGEHDKNKNSSCQSHHGGMEDMKIPLYVITPAIIIGVIILIKIIGLIVIGIPAITAPLFSGLRGLFKHNDEMTEGGGGYGWGQPSPSPQYGPPVPSSPYGAASSLSRQTSVLNAIDDANNQYNGEYYNYPYQYQPQQPSSNNYANSANYRTNYNYNSLPYAYSSNPAASSYNSADQGPSSLYSTYESQSNPSPSVVNTNDALQNYMQFVTQNKQQNASSNG